MEPYIKTYGRQPRGLDDELWPQNFAVQRIFHQGDQVYELTEEKKLLWIVSSLHIMAAPDQLTGP